VPAATATAAIVRVSSFIEVSLWTDRLPR